MFGAAEGTKDVYLFFVSDKLFPKFLRTQEAYIPAGALGALSLYMVFLF